MEALKAFLESVERRKIPEFLVSRGEALRSQRRAFEHFLAANPDHPVYGVNTYVGHRDREGRKRDDPHDLQRYLLQSHVISGEGDHYSAFEAACIGFAKVWQIAAGGLPVSETLFEHLCRALSSAEFRPLIPRKSSYSSGDVIPAAHWLSQLADYFGAAHRLKSGELISLLNGSFVHVGYAASLAVRIKEVWALFVESSRACVVAAKANPKNYAGWLSAGDAVSEGAVRALSAALKPSAADVPQDPVSFRTIPQVIESLSKSSQALFGEIITHLSRPSGNPLMLPAGDPFGETLAPHPQGSFLAPSLTIATSAVIEAVLLCGWMSVSRTNHLLSGRVAGIPLDGQHENDPFGYIQWPKYMQACLEEARMLAGRRAFASGGSTSYGIEDLWSNGLLTCEVLSGVMERISTILACELFIATNVLRAFCQQEIAAAIPAETDLRGQGAAEILTRIRAAVCGDAGHPAGRVFHI